MIDATRRPRHRHGANRHAGMHNRRRVQRQEDLANRYREQGQYTRAEPLLRRALARAERLFGPDDFDVASILNNLGMLYKFQGRYAEAEPLYRRALTIVERMRGPDHPEVASIYHNLGGLEHARGRFALGEPMARRSVAIREHALGPEHPDVAADKAALAALLDGQGKFEEAQALYWQAIAVFERAFGLEDLELSFSFNNLAAIEGARGNHTEAERLYRRALAIKEQTGSATVMASLLIVSFAPTVLFLLIGGVAVDRFSRIKIMLVSDVVRGTVASGVAVLAMCNLLQIWQLYLLNLIFGIVDAFFQPAYSATIPDLVPGEDLPSANALSSLGVQAGRIAGPALGAAVIAVGGTPLAFALNGLTFFIAAVLLAPLRGRSAPHAVESPQGQITAPMMFADLREGIGTVLATPWLWITILVSALSNVTLAGPYSVALPFRVDDTWHADIGTLGLLYALFPIGCVIGGLWLGWGAQLHQRGLLIYAGLIGAGLMLSMFGLPVPFVVLGFAAIVNGAALEVGSLAWTSLLQQRIPHDKLGRVASVDALGSFALIPIGYALAGWATEMLGAPPVLVIGGGLTVVVAALVLIGHPAIRGLD